MLKGGSVNICCISRQRIFVDDSGWSCSAAPSSSHTSDKWNVAWKQQRLWSHFKGKAACIYPECSWMFEMRPLWGLCVWWGGGLHSCRIRVKRNFKETTSLVRRVKQKTANCHCICAVVIPGYRLEQSTRCLYFDGQRLSSFPDPFICSHSPT